MSLHLQCLARHKQDGVSGVNRFLHEQYPDPRKRVRAMQRLEVVGPWKIKWHYPRRLPDNLPDDGVVWSSGEWNEVSLRENTAQSKRHCRARPSRNARNRSRPISRVDLIR